MSKPITKRKIGVGAVKKRKPAPKKKPAVKRKLKKIAEEIAAVKTLPPPSDLHPVEQLFEVTSDQGFPIHLPLAEALARMRSQIAVLRKHRFPLCRCPFCWFFRLFA
jgi:hypothetical protein